MVATLFMSSNKSQMFDEKIEGAHVRNLADIVMISGDWKNIV